MTTELTKAAQRLIEASEAAAKHFGYSRLGGCTLEDSNVRVELRNAADELRALTQRPAAQEVDDGDVTGQPGPLPETGWDEVPEGAFRKPSPTAGMNLGERIKHVGGRENAAGYIEFGSVAAVRALVRQYLRDLPAPQQATPLPFSVVADPSIAPGEAVVKLGGDEVGRIVNIDAQQATPTSPLHDGTRGPFDGEPMSARKAAYFMQRFRRDEKLLGPNEQLAIDFVLALLEAQQATPEPSINWFGTHFTYKNQPCDNVTCWRLGEAARSAKPGGDLIDHGLSLLQELEKHGYGVYALAAAQAKGGGQ